MLNFECADTNHLGLGDDSISGLQQPSLFFILFVLFFFSPFLPYLSFPSSFFLSLLFPLLHSFLFFTFFAYSSKILPSDMMKGGGRCPPPHLPLRTPLPMVAMLEGWSIFMPAGTNKFKKLLF